MEIPLDYHILFLTMTFVLFIISIFLMFIDVTLEKAVAAFILLLFNFVICGIVSLGFGAIDLYGFDSTGAVVHNVYTNMWPFIYLYWMIGYINIMLLFYCVYIFYKKPWEQYMMKGKYENEIQYQDTEW